MKFPLLLLLISILLFSCQQEKKTTVVRWNLAQNYYQRALQNSIDSLQALKSGKPQKLAIATFKKARSEFKKTESYAARLNPEVGARVNGPALPIFKEDNRKILDPIGFQAIEETLFENYNDQPMLHYQVDRTIGYLQNLLQNVQERKLTPARYFIAVHEQLLRVLSFGISHFDTPVSHWGFQESAISLESLLTTFELSLSLSALDLAPAEYQLFKSQIARNINYLQQATSFDEFDYYLYIREFFNPLTKSWVALRNKLELWEAPDYKALNFNAFSFFEKNAFNDKYFVNPSVGMGTQASLALGKQLFHDKRLSTSGTLSCASCHKESKAFTDQLKTSLGADGEPLKRNAPTLINSLYNQSFFWDGRSGNLESQIRSVFSAHNEFNRSFKELPAELLSDSSYTDLFLQVYGKSPKNNNELIKSISQYVASLKGFDSKFDRNMRKEESSFTALEKKGMQLFMGKALCGSCHFIPLMNGTLPPYYAHTEKEVIGVPSTAENLAWDTTDLGFYPFFEVEIHRGMFRTPTVRNAALTAPYMHNGVYETLEEVMDFYNKGGGAGLGFPIEHQTLPFDSLALQEEELQALTAFIKTLNDRPRKTLLADIL